MNDSKVKIPQQLLGSGTSLIDMHPEQYTIDATGDKILYYYTYNLSMEEIASKVSTPTEPFPVNRVNTFLVLAKRKIWHQLTGECIRDDEYLSNKISNIVYNARLKN